MDKEPFVVKQVSLNEVDRLKNTIEMRDATIEYQQDKYLQLLRRFDNKEPFGLNNLLFTYDELITILKSNYHPLKNYIERWFGTYKDFEENDNCLIFSEDGIEVHKDCYWLVNIKKDYACTLKNIDKLNRKLYELDNSEEVDNNE